jgi:DNA-binding response OmpR family regulator
MFSTTMSTQRINYQQEPNRNQNPNNRGENLLSCVLIIDEDNAVNEPLKSILEKENFKVATVCSGREGIAFAQKNDIHAVILNLRLLEDDGWQIFTALRACSRAPVIVLSPLTSPKLVARALDMGADEVLTKPLAASRLIAHLKRLTKRAQAEREASLARAS